MLKSFEKDLCEKLLATGKIIWESHFDNNDQYEISYDEKNTFHITRDNGEWIYIRRVA